VLLEVNDGRTIGDIKAPFVEAYNSRYFALSPYLESASFFIEAKRSVSTK
jgi:hypothetical protein